MDFDADCHYFGQLVDRLRRNERIGAWDVVELLWLQALWHDRPAMWQDRQVWLHGDATPANILFGHGLDVAAIDLERTKRDDRMFDVGRVAGEIQHAFMTRDVRLRSGNQGVPGLRAQLHHHRSPGPVGDSRREMPTRPGELRAILAAMISKPAYAARDRWDVTGRC